MYGCESPNQRERKHRKGRPDARTRWFYRTRRNIPRGHYLHASTAHTHTHVYASKVYTRTKKHEQHRPGSEEEGGGCASVKTVRLCPPHSSAKQAEEHVERKPGEALRATYKAARAQNSREWGRPNITRCAYSTLQGHACACVRTGRHGHLHTEKPLHLSSSTSGPRHVAHALSHGLTLPLAQAPSSAPTHTQQRTLSGATHTHSTAPMLRGNGTQGCDTRVQTRTRQQKENVHPFGPPCRARPCASDHGGGRCAQHRERRGNTRETQRLTGARLAIKPAQRDNARRRAATRQTRTHRRRSPSLLSRNC